MTPPKPPKKNRYAHQAVAFLLLLVGCAKGEHTEGEGFGTIADPPDAATGWVEVEEGQEWCARVPNPLQCDGEGDPDQWSCVGDESQVNEPAPDGGDPKGCLCAGPELNDELTNLLSSGEAQVELADGGYLFNFSHNVFATAEQRCLDLLDGDTDHSECEYNILKGSTVAEGITPIFKSGAFGDCSAVVDFDGDGSTGAEKGMEVLPSDDYADYYRLADVVVWNSSNSRYDVDNGFFDDIVDNPGWLLKEDPRFVPISGGFKVIDSRSGTLMYAIGLRDDDIIKEIDGYPLTTVSEALTALDALYGNTTFDLKIKRSGNIVTISYKLVP